VSQKRPCLSSPITLICLHQYA